MYTLEEAVQDILETTGASINLSSTFDRLDLQFRIKYSDLYKKEERTPEQIKILIENYIFKYSLFPTEKDPDEVFASHPEVVGLVYGATDPAYRHKSSVSKLVLLDMITREENDKGRITNLADRLKKGPGEIHHLAFIDRDLTAPIRDYICSPVDSKPATHRAPDSLQ